jgi:hypothetical protein
LPAGRGRRAAGAGGQKSQNLDFLALPLYRVVIDGPADRQGDKDVYEVLPRDEPQGTAFLPAGLDVDGVVLVEARPPMIRLPPAAFEHNVPSRPPHLI